MMMNTTLAQLRTLKLDGLAAGVNFRRIGAISFSA
jgi:hypothetical protein